MMHVDPPVFTYPTQLEVKAEECYTFGMDYNGGTSTASKLLQNVSIHCNPVDASSDFLESFLVGLGFLLRWWFTISHAFIYATLKIAI